MSCIKKNKFNHLAIKKSEYETFRENTTTLKPLIPLEEIQEYFFLNQEQTVTVEHSTQHSQNLLRLKNINSKYVLIKLSQYLERGKPFLTSKLTLEEVAFYLGIRPDQLSAIINSQLHISFTTLINFKRLEEATRLLTLTTNMSIIEVALECGFGSKSSFNRLFKQQFKLTPSQYRKLKYQR